MCAHACVDERDERVASFYGPEQDEILASAAAMEAKGRESFAATAAETKAAEEERERKEEQTKQRKKLKAQFERDFGSWTDDLKSVEIEQPLFLDVETPTKTLPTLSTPLDFFRLYFTNELIDSFVTNTNAFGQSNQRLTNSANGPTKTKAKWTDTNSDELLALLSVLIEMGSTKVIHRILHRFLPLPPSFMCAFVSLANCIAHH